MHRWNIPKFRHTILARVNHNLKGAVWWNWWVWLWSEFSKCSQEIIFRLGHFMYLTSSWPKGSPIIFVHSLLFALSINCSSQAKFLRNYVKFMQKGEKRRSHFSNQQIPLNLNLIRNIISVEASSYLQYITFLWQFIELSNKERKRCDALCISIAYQIDILGINRVLHCNNNPAILAIKNIRINYKV